jgi:hypothetical protein
LGGTPAGDEPVPSLEIAPALQPFEALIGQWKGTAIPTANRLKGWRETHDWAWRFKSGRPVGISLTLTGNKTLQRGLITVGTKPGTYILEADSAGGASIRYDGSIDESGRGFVFENRSADKAADAERLVVRVLANGLRYTLWQEQRASTDTAWNRTVDVNVGRAGESFAAGGDTEKLPKCIVTGGAAALAVSIDGRSFPVCCTGCRDEVLADPEKYLARIAARADAASKSQEGPSTASSSKKDSTTPMPTAKASDRKSNTAPKSTAPSAKSKPKSAELLEQAADLEKRGKTAAALIFYRRIAKEFSSSPEVSKAIERIKVLEDASK